jgi:hypothetical protein
MFLRASIRKKDGKVHRYFSVVENKRVGRRGRVVQRHVLYLGEINDSQERATSVPRSLHKKTVSVCTTALSTTSPLLDQALTGRKISKHGSTPRRPARVRQKGSIEYVWARIGSRPPMVRDNRHGSVHIFGAICPARGVGAAIIMPVVNTEAMNLRLNGISTQVATGAHALLVATALAGISQVRD